MPKNAGSLPNENLDVESLTQEQMQRILQVGESASQLLKSPVYNLAYNQVLNTKYQEWLTSDPKEERKRESLYLQAKALTDVTELMATAVTDAEMVMEQQTALNDPRQQAANMQDTQGFGLDFGSVN